MVLAPTRFATILFAVLLLLIFVLLDNSYFPGVALYGDYD
jgi:hypothetical protein